MRTVTRACTDASTKRGEKTVKAVESIEIRYAVRHNTIDAKAYCKTGFAFIKYIVQQTAQRGRAAFLNGGT
jgi:hypothetical protein